MTNPTFEFITFNYGSDTPPDPEAIKRINKTYKENKRKMNNLRKKLINLGFKQEVKPKENDWSSDLYTYHYKKDIYRYGTYHLQITELDYWEFEFYACFNGAETGIEGWAQSPIKFHTSNLRDLTDILRLFSFTKIMNENGKNDLL